ncbi:MAG: hypothetical protein ACI8P9_001291 [Parasphingorhabdus sp.]|jgi:hypothetical protein
MPYQNRVDPWGNLVAVQARGAWHGNRGILHNDKQEIVAPWRHKAWIICQLEFKGRQRKVFSPNTYSELFFLDEATAFSAGHRPCAECRRQRYNEFKVAWCDSNPEYGSRSMPVSRIDQQLHKERAQRGGIKVSYQSEFQQLPDGVFLELNSTAVLIWKERIWQWTFQGYQLIDFHPKAADSVTVLTPASIVKLFRTGFTPQVHSSIA